MGIFGSLIGLDVVTDAAKSITASVSDVLRKLIPDADKRLEVEAKITEAGAAALAAQYQAMQAVMAADAQSESWATRNARPFTVFWCLGMITWVVISSLFNLQNATIDAIKAVPDNLWNLVMVGIGGYILAKSITDGIKATKTK